MQNSSKELHHIHQNERLSLCKLICTASSHCITHNNPDVILYCRHAGAWSGFL